MSKDYSVDHVIFVLGYNDLKEGRDSAILGYNDLKEGRDSARILCDAREALQIARGFFLKTRFIVSEVVASNNSRFFKRELDLLNCGLEELSSNNHLVTFSPHPILSPNDHQHLFHKDGTHLTQEGETQLTSDLRRAAKGILPLPHPIRRERNPIQYSRSRQNSNSQDDPSNQNSFKWARGNQGPRFGPNGWGKASS